MTYLTFKKANEVPVKGRKQVLTALLNKRIMDSEQYTIQAVENCQARVKAKIDKFFDQKEMEITRRLRGLISSGHFTNKTELVKISPEELNELSFTLNEIIEQDFCRRFKVTKAINREEIVFSQHIYNLDNISKWIKIKNNTIAITEILERIATKAWERYIGNRFLNDTLNRICGDFSISSSLLELSGINSKAEKAELADGLIMRIHCLLQGIKLELCYDINLRIAQIFYVEQDVIENRMRAKLKFAKVRSILETQESYSIHLAKGLTV